MHSKAMNLCMSVCLTNSAGSQTIEDPDQNNKEGNAGKTLEVAHFPESSFLRGSQQFITLQGMLIEEGTETFLQTASWDSIDYEICRKKNTKRKSFSLNRDASSRAWQDLVGNCHCKPF